MTVRRIAVACLIVAMVSGPIATAGQTPTLDKIYGWMKKSFAPETPNTPSPVSGAMTVARPVTLTWVSTGADTYDVRLGTTSTPTTVASGLTTATYTPANLLAGTKYYWQIVAKNISGGGTTRSSVGPLWNVTTATATVPPVDCVLSAWSAWSACNQTGTQTRTRTILTAPANGGLACGPLTETQSCTSIPPSPVVVSPDQTVVPPATAIIDAGGHQWTISGTAILLDGVPAAGGIGVAICWANQTIYVFGGAVNGATWYRWIEGTGWLVFGTTPPVGCAAVTLPPPLPSPITTPITTGPVTTSMVVGFYAGNIEPSLYQYRVRVDGGLSLTLSNVTCVDPTPPATAALCTSPVMQALADALNVPGSHAVTMMAYEPVAAVESASSPAFILTTP